MAKKDGGPAFPRPAHFNNDIANYDNYAQEGMTLRAWLTGQAIAGICGDGHTFWDSSQMQGNPEAIAQKAVEIADAALAVLAEGK